MKINEIRYVSTEEAKAAADEVTRLYGKVFRMLAGNYADTEEYQMHKRELDSIRDTPLLE